MTTPAGLLEALDEPALLVERCGRIRQANRAARRLLGPDRPLSGVPLAELAADPPDEVAAMLRRCAGTGQPLLGALRLRTNEGGVQPCRWRGCRVPAPPDEPPLLLLRFERAAADPFRVLSEKIVALNAEIARNKRFQLELRSALEQKEILLRELHHRVKNNLQMLLGILLIGERGAKLPAAREVIREARLRVEAMALVQRLLYRQGDLSGVDGEGFLRELCAGIERACGRPGIRLEVRPGSAFLGLDAAAAVGLIVNELVTNAYKHAFADRAEGRIAVALAPGNGPAGDLTLTVEDDGCGFAPQNDRAGTGLMLVRGLVGQLGGACRFEPADGTRCVVTLNLRREPGREPAAAAPG